MVFTPKTMGFLRVSLKLFLGNVYIESMKIRCIPTIIHQCSASYWYLPPATRGRPLMPPDAGVLGPDEDGSHLRNRNK